MRWEEAGAENARELLRSLPPDLLLSLSSTVTNKLIQAKTEQEAIQAIILHSPSLDSILRRKLITCEVLFQYLHYKGVSVTPTTTKTDLIKQIIALWTSNQETQSSTEIQTVHQDVAKENDVKTLQLNTLGQTFVEWFYRILFNSSLHSDQFWENCDLQVTLLKDNGESQTLSCSGANQVITGLLQIRNEYGVILNPNMNGGISAEMDPHGLVLVTSCGTIHTSNACTGVYEQQFALIPDPFSQGDWRIKRSKLQLRQVASADGGHILSVHSDIKAS